MSDILTVVPYVPQPPPTGDLPPMQEAPILSTDDEAPPIPSRGACTYCKKLKMRCVYPVQNDRQDGDPTCQRCERTGKVCIVEPRRGRPQKVRAQPPDASDRVPEESNSSSDDNPQQPVQSQAARPRLPGACIHCKKLKIRCVFPNPTGPCTRCEAYQHGCVIQGRRRR
ncbi:hypothetical protein JAAARDRAFT_56078 [Jaapia argillacea MUCL 33604]|uniref:Zn(2)-C6 fungal-type domain-containing protein n=1 Tax=Jaapia argillacea MUCL 33604 TaxID=933084 RepID=A0A067Q9B5_9AGAM|nr:hypothetical protein JAAARDRAFT_56078 [Jaapia argillacea MUCL 33604]